LPAVAFETESDWSKTQTITIPRSTSSPEAEPFPATLVFVSSVGIALAVIGLSIYFKKRK
jgi:hypothetical protein